MNIVIPVAGAGRRFREAGYVQPKMLIEAAERPMLYWALDSLFPGFKQENLLIVCLKEHLRRTYLWDVVRSAFPEANVVSIPGVSRGQAETVYLAREHYKEDEPLIIYNCDTYMRGRAAHTISRLDPDIDGLISVFQSTDPSMSYVDLDADGSVRSVREKEVISSWATTGLYYFASTRRFLALVEEAFKEPLPAEGEWYVAPLYNRLIERGGKVAVDYADCCYPLGTPQQLSVFIDALPGLDKLYPTN
ncbi:glycosyltransferase family 2 protein [Cohnella soli]|uniref:Glycosyltransferase family 2 protein n=1 Tax=Cohnella soli TaxID=425005 RepID=A0ABW0I4I5_9BACL